MQKDPFVKGLIILALVLAAVIAGVQFAQSKVALSSFIWLVLVYFFALSYITWMIAKPALKKDNKTFVTRVYSSIGIRLMFSFFPIILYVIFSNTTELTFVVAYLLLYFIFTAYEIRSMLRILKTGGK